MYAKQYRTRDLQRKPADLQRKPADLQRKPADLQQFTRYLPDAHAKQYR